MEWDYEKTGYFLHCMGCCILSAAVRDLQHGSRDTEGIFQDGAYVCHTRFFDRLTDDGRGPDLLAGLRHMEI